jgi:hypothetical protein
VKKKEMKTTTRLIGVVAIAMVLSIAFSGVALACCPIPETVCTSKISTTTAVTCMGTVTESESLNFQQATVDINAIPPLAAGELYADTRYSEDLMSSDGYINYMKAFDLDTSNSEGLPEFNLEVAKTFDYVANNGGRLVFSETVAIDAISDWQPNPPLMCPFAAQPAGQIPESCEYVAAGSTLDVTEVSATTNTQTITTAMSSDTTPITMHYDISAGGTDLTSTAGAVGSASAFMTVHDMEGQIIGPALGSEVTYVEELTVSGIFEFSTSKDYVSGILHP